MLSTILLYASPVLSCVAIVFSLIAIQITKKKSVRAITLRRQMKIDDQVEDHELAIASLGKKVRNLQSRLNMAKARAAKKELGDDGEPDQRADPEGWKIWARNKHLRKV